MYIYFTINNKLFHLQDNNIYCSEYIIGFSSLLLIQALCETL